MAESGKSKDEVTVGPRKFQIRGTLGRGGFSEVYAGVDKETGKRVALKMMFDVQNDEVTYKQTCDEIKMMRRLTHPGLIKLLGYDLHAKHGSRNCVILVQELAPNRELFEYLLHSKKTFSENLVMYVMNSIFKAIEFMHDKGIAHRDLKPENILLDKDFNLKIADFGFAKFFNKNGQAVKMRTELGTRGYMAPEISKNSNVPRSQRKSYDQKVDVFALGVIMFICSAGFPPFRQTNSEDWWFDKIMKKEWHYFWKAHERKATLSPLAKKCLEGMIAAEPADRMDIKQLLAHDFLTNNPVGKIMDKGKYQNEMKDRYANVKKAIQKAKMKKKEGGDRDIAGSLLDSDFKKKFDDFGAFVPASFLCQNDIRAAIYKAPEAEVYSSCTNACIKHIESRQELGAQAERAISSDLDAHWKQFEASQLKEAFSNGTAEEIIPFLPENFQNKEEFVKFLNTCVIGEDIDIPMSAIEEYQQYDQSDDLDLFQPEEMENTPGCYHVRFGFGTLLHLMKQLYAKGGGEDAREKLDKDKFIELSGIEGDAEHGRAVITYTVTESMVLSDQDGEEEYNLSDEIKLELKMWKLDNKQEGRVVVDDAQLQGDDDSNVFIYQSDPNVSRPKETEVPGFVLTIKELKKDDALPLFLDMIPVCVEKLLKDSEIFELTY